jgi:osmotically-inducible protein OsmY
MTAHRSDFEIQKDVQAELAWDARVTPSEIGVAVNHGVVTLTGSVDSYGKRWGAEQAAHRVRGVRAVANDIDVRLPIASQRTDPDVAVAAVRSLEALTTLRAEDIDVTVSNGWVTLRGEVEWQYQREDAERSVRDLWGVRGVSNQLIVGARPTPEQLKQRIEHALVRIAQADANKIHVEVHGNTVILKGTVRAWAERQEAERVAWMAPGVTAVEDRIQVESY